MSRTELIDAIDEKNNVVGQVTKEEIYQRQISHRVIHVIVVDGEKIFLPRRSLALSYCPGFYCSSAGGHVQSGESSHEGALRELKEEIGLDGPLVHLEDFFFLHEFKVHVSLYIKIFDKQKDLISLNPEEVMSGQFYSWPEINGLNKNKFHPQLLTCLEKTKLFLGVWRAE